MSDYRVTIDGDRWECPSPAADYDAIHAAAGAIIVGADEVEIERLPDDQEVLE